MIYVTTRFYAAVAGLQVYWDNSLQLTRFTTQMHCKKSALWVMQNQCYAACERSEASHKTGGKHSPQMRSTPTAEAFLSKDKPNLLIS